MLRAELPKLILSSQGDDWHPRPASVETDADEAKQNSRLLRSMAVKIAAS